MRVNYRASEKSNSVLPAHVLVLALVVASRAALAGEPVSAPTGPGLAEDPQLKRFLEEALAGRPEPGEARARVRAEQARVPQAGALAEPVVNLGIQNDGFGRIRIGEMESSWLSLGVAQTFPWTGKRGLRAGVASLGAAMAEADLKRVRLTIRAEVERAYVDLLLVRGRLELLARRDALLTQSEGLARARYEVGEGTQSEYIRAQLERNRLRQRRLAIVADERRGVVVMNRLRGRPLEEPVVLERSLADLPDPVLPAARVAREEADAESPEIEKGILAARREGARRDLAAREVYPDLTVSAGVMPRWGKFEPMWQAGLSFPLPVWQRARQARAVEGAEAGREAESLGVEAVRSLLRQRVEERRTLLSSLLEANRFYRTGLLVQSEAAVTSALAELRVGRSSLAAVLDAIGGYVADVDGLLESMAAAQRVDIAARELSLDPVAGGATEGGMARSAGPRGGATVPPAPVASPGPPPQDGSGGTSMSRM